MSLWDVADRLATCRWVDLTHGFGPDTPHWAGYDAEQRRPAMTLPEHGFFVDVHTLAGAYGTHVDAPAHMHAGLPTVDQLPVEQALLPLVVLDLSAEAGADPDTVCTPAHVQAWERAYGRVPPLAFVALRTDWSHRWPDRDALLNRDADGVPHTPGWSVEAVDLLCRDRGVAAIGHETGDTDPAAASHGDVPPDRPLAEVMHERYAAEAAVLRHGCWQVEYLARLDEVPPAGALAIALWPKPLGAGAFPCRVVAVCP